MDTRKILLPILLAFVLIGSASAQDVLVDGLTEKDIETEFTDNGVNFKTSYLDKTVPYKDVFIPEEYHDSLADFDVNYKEAGNSGNKKFSIDYSLKDVDNPEKLPNKLDGYSYSADFKDTGGKGKGGQISWSVQSNIQQISGNPIQEDADYDLKLTGNNEKAQIDGSLNRVNGSKQIANDEKLGFNISAEELAFDSGVFKTKVSSHYEHLIIDHEVRSSVSHQYGTNLTFTTNSYSGEETDIVPFVDGKAQAYTTTEGQKQRSVLELDNRYDQNHYNATVIVAYKDNYNLSSINASTGVEELPNANYTRLYSDAESQIENHNLSQDLKVNDPGNYKFIAFNISAPPDSVEKISSTISTNSSLTVSGHKMYVIGSIGGTTTYESGGGSGGGYIDNFDHYKELSVTDTSSSGAIIDKVLPVEVQCGNQDTTGTGDIQISCGGITAEDDIAVTDENGNLLDYDIEKFTLDAGGEAILWVENTWSRDDSIQARVLYGDNTQDTFLDDPAGTYSADTAMVQYFNEDPVSAIDRTGYDNDGDVDGPVSTTGVFDKGASFDGSNDHISFSSLENEIDSDTFEQILWTGWIKQPSGVSDQRYFFAKGGGGLYIRMGYLTFTGAGNRLAFGARDTSGNAYIRHLSTDNLQDDQWHQITLYFDNNGNDAEFFVDGNLRSSTLNRDQGTGDNIGPSYPWMMGAERDGGTNNFPGDFDNVRVYDRSQTDEDWVEAGFEASPYGNQVFFDQSVEKEANVAPSINDITTSEFNWNVGVSQDIYADVTDPDGNLDTVTYEVIDPQGNTDYSGTLTLESGDNYTAIDAFTVDERGEWELEIRAEDTDGAYNQSNTVQNVNPPRSDLVEPVNEEIGSNPVQFNFTPTCYTDPNVGFPCSSAELYVNESGTWQNVKSISQPQNNTVSTINYDLPSSDTYKWNVRVIDAKDRYSFDPQNASFTLSLNEPPVVENLTLNPESPVGTEESVDFTVESEDSDGSVTEAVISLINPQGTEKVSNAQMSELNSVTTTQPWRYTYSHEELPENLGGWTAEVTVTDDDGATDTTSTTYQLEDASPPKYYNYQDNTTGILYSEETLLIESDWRDNGTGLSQAVLATNETGEWQNYTAQYGSPVTFNQESQSLESADFTWKNISFKGDLGYRVWAEDADGNWNSTEINTQQVAKKYRENVSQSTSVRDTQSNSINSLFNFNQGISEIANVDQTTSIFEDLVQVNAVTDIATDSKLEFQNVVQTITGDTETSENTSIVENQVQTAAIIQLTDTDTSLSREILQEAVFTANVNETGSFQEATVQSMAVTVSALDTLDMVENPVQQVAIAQDEDSTTVLQRGVSQFQALNQKTRETAYIIENPSQVTNVADTAVDIWNPFVDAKQKTGVETGVDTDLGIFENIQDMITVDSSLSNNTGPREVNTTIYGESLGASNYSTTVQVKVRDFEGGNISSVTINDVTQNFPGNETTEVANITIGNVKEYTGGIQATDSRGVTRDINFGFKITDNPYRQTTSSVNLTTQDLNKTDSVTNLQESQYDFYYRLSHSPLGQEATSNNSWKGNLAPGVTGQQHTTEFYGDFLLEDTNDWVQNLNKTSTDEKQYIRRTFEINSLTGDEWSNVATPTVQPEDGFSPCEICSRNPISFEEDFEDKTFYTDTGDIIDTRLTGTIGDFVIGERDTYFEQYRYTQTVENGLTLQDIQVQESINDTGFNYGSFLNVELDDETYGNNLLQVEETVSCTTSMPSFSTGQFNNQDWKACSQDLNGNTQPEVFKVVIPVISQTDYNEEIRLGGFTGEPPEDDIEPFPGLQTECEEGTTENDLICVRDQWRTQAQATRQLSIANTEAGQIGESLGILVGLLSMLYLYGLWRREDEE